MNAKKVFVTGGSGFIGSAIVKSLVIDGHEVTVLDNNSRGSLEKLSEVKDQFNFIEGDIRDEKNFNGLQGYDSIIHLAYVNGTKYFYEIPYDILDIGITGMLNVMNAIKKYDIGQLTFASTSEVYQKPNRIPTPENIELIVPDVLNSRYSYGGGKIASELLAVNYAKQYNLNLKIFRPHNVYGPNMGYEHVTPEVIKKIIDSKDGNIQMQGDGSDTRAFIYIKDFVAAFNLVFNDISDDIIFHIGNNEEIKVKDVYKEIGIKSGKKINLIEGIKPAGATNRRCPDNSKIISLGYKQNFTFKKGITDTFDWYSKKIMEQR
jgi:nucleoside-diphosphate-sugar epimerase